MILRNILCVNCLNKNARLALDRKHRPFIFCHGCGSRNFLPSFDPCLMGMAVLQEPMIEYVAKLSEDAKTASLKRFLGYLRVQSQEPTRVVTATDALMTAELALTGTGK